MRIRTLIVDDEPLARLGVALRLRRSSHFIIVGECGGGREAKKAIQQVNPQLIFLDVEMPGSSGLEILKEMPSEDIPALVFLTAHQQYAVEAFENQALDYLLKPIDDDRFEACLSRVRQFFDLQEQARLWTTMQAGTGDLRGSRSVPATRFAVQKGAGIEYVSADEVDWIEAVGDYAGLHVQSKVHLIRESLNSLEQRLEQTRFRRIHRSTIVRIDRILRIEPLPNRDCIITLRNQVVLRVSRTYSQGLRDKMTNKTAATPHASWS